MVTVIADTGRFVIGMVITSGRGAILFYQAIVQSRSAFGNFGKIMRQEYVCGVASIPVVTITALFTGMVLSLQTGLAFKSQIGDPSLILGSLMGVAITREMGPVLTAVVVAGFVGGGISSVLGTMRVNEEIDALDVMSINPVRYLVMPRLLAMIVAVPLLTVYANMVGIWGGAFVAKVQLDVPYAIYFRDCWNTLQYKDVYFGLLKAMIFGICICMVACEQGFSARGGAEGVGRATMTTVVYSFLLILFTNFLMLSLVWRIFLQ